MDRFWGTGDDFKGSNQFGAVLMELRDEFAKSGTPNRPIQLPEPPAPIEFNHNHDEGYHTFTNSAPVPVDFDGKIWKTSEHLYQAWKVRHSSFLNWNDFQTSVQ